ncbi:MAG: hypothetical protein GVY19_10175 [Bacteroidetes bacterium]|jgi:hypothetical protein|nr:hypothetical protein [Bacteroidota bacterium]
MNNIDSPPVIKHDSGYVYMSGNLSYQLNPDGSKDQTIMVADGKDDIVSKPIFTEFTDRNVIIPAQDLLNSIKDEVGARWPIRDTVDARIVNDAFNRLNQGPEGYKNSPEDAGGYPDPEQGISPDDTDNDGIPNKYEGLFDCDPGEFDSNNCNQQGYTKLEEYLNAIITDN